MNYFARVNQVQQPVLATNAAGAQVWSLAYLPFGGVRASTGVPATLRFPGQWFQSENGLHQNWMRDYDPTLGRYLQADPLGLVDEASVYGYAAQNPGRYVDPRGQCVGPYIWLMPACIAAVGIIYDILSDEDGCITAPELAYILLSNAPQIRGWKWAKWAANAGGGGGKSSGDGPFTSDQVWSKNAPDQVTPGSPPREHFKYNSRTGETERSIVEYDQYGRQARRTDYTDHGYGNPPDPGDYHSSPHVHTREYGPGYGNKGKETRSNFQ